MEALVSKVCQRIAKSETRVKVAITGKSGELNLSYMFFNLLDVNRMLLKHYTTAGEGGPDLDEKTPANRKLVSELSAANASKLHSLAICLGEFAPSMQQLLQSSSAAPHSSTSEPGGVQAGRAARRSGRENTSGPSPSTAVEPPRVVPSVANALEAILTKLGALDARVGVIESGIACTFFSQLFSRFT
jgi:hypothetical protein